MISLWIYYTCSNCTPNSVTSLPVAYFPSRETKRTLGRRGTIYFLYMEKKRFWYEFRLNVQISCCYPTTHEKRKPNEKRLEHSRRYDSTKCKRAFISLVLERDFSWIVCDSDQVQMHCTNSEPIFGRHWFSFFLCNYDQKTKRGTCRKQWHN